MWTCKSGRCLLSCGATQVDRQEDIAELLGGTGLTAAEADERWCPPCRQTGVSYTAVAHSQERT